MVEKQLTELEQEIKEASFKIYDNEYKLHEKLDQLIEKENWNDSKLRQEVKTLQDEWYRLQHNVFGLHDKQELTNSEIKA